MSALTFHISNERIKMDRYIHVHQMEMFERADFWINQPIAGRTQDETREI
jgi:hypothetical protein